MNTQSLLDEYFIETRHKLLDLAAFMDRIDRAGGAAGDFRWESLRASLEILRDAGPDRTRRILELMSDPTTAPPRLHRPRRWRAPSPMCLVPTFGSAPARC